MSELIYGSSGDCRLELGNPSEAEISAPLLELSRRKATRLVNSYIEKAYPSQIPFSASGDVPLILQNLTDDLSVYFIKRSIHQGPSPLSDTIKEEYYDKSIKVLEEIRDNKLEISELAGKQVNILSNRNKYIPVFSGEDIVDSVIDPDLSNDISDSKS